MIFFGWGKKSKKITDVGLMRCQNCDNITGFELREMSNRVSLYFIPVAKWNKKCYLVCPVCDAGFEVEDSKKQMIIEETAMLPDNNTAISIWDELISIINDLAEEDNNPEDFLNIIERKLTSIGYKKDDIRYVVGVFYQETIHNNK